MRGPSVAVVVVMLAGALLGLPGTAGALDFTPCRGTADYECATVPVPLDPARPDGRTVGLEVRRLLETRDAPGVLLAVAGGPGQSSTLFIDDFADVLAEALDDRQLVVVDQRGTGASGALRCDALAGAAAIATLAALQEAVGRCGEQLGEERRFYTTTHVVDDLEAVRAALGTDRMAIFGISHGAYVAQRYARRHPARVDGLVLDSPVAQDQGGPFDRSSYLAVPRALRAVCAPGRCRGFDPVADVRRLAARLRTAPVSGTVVDARGALRSATLRGEAELFDLLVASDFSDPLRGALPAAMHAALRGDATPLLRLVAAGEATADGRQVDLENEDPAEFSNALFFATTCQEKPVPWGSPAAELAGRDERRRQAIAALGPGAFGVFGSTAADATQVGSAFCTRWPPTEVPAPPAPGPIDVPVLLLSGETDLRTPTEEAVRSAAAMPEGSLVRVPATGHAVVSQRLECVQRALRRYFARYSVGNPCAGREPVAGERPARPAPLRLAEVAREGLRGRGRAIAGAALEAVEDAIRTVSVQGVLDSSVQLGALRAGTFCARPGAVARDGRRPLLLTLSGAEHVPGVALTGSAIVKDNRVTWLRMRLSGARIGSGRLALRGRRLAGRAGRRRVRTVVSPSRLRMPALRVPTSVARETRGTCD